MAVVSLAISQERQQACFQRLLQSVWTDRDYPQIEAYGREGQADDSYSKGYYAHRRHYMLAALCVVDLSTANIFNNPFGNNEIWPLLEKDIRIGPWTWAEHIDLIDWALVHTNMSRHYHATNFPEYTPRAYPDSIRLSTAGKDAIRSRFGLHGGRAMDFGPPVLVPLHAPETTSPATLTLTATAGTLGSISVSPSEGISPYSYEFAGGSESWMTLADGIFMMLPPPKHPGGSGETLISITDAAGQMVVATIRWAVTPAAPTG